MKTHSYWLDTAPDLQRNAPVGPAPTRVDVAIVGAGYTGLSAARRLAIAGASVAVFERAHVGWGASSRNAGQVLTGLRLDASALIAQYGETHARRLFEASRAAMDFLERTIADESIACDLERTGHILAACTPRHFAAFRGEQALLSRVFDHRVEMIGPVAQQAEIGSTTYHGLLLDSRSAGLNPARYVAGLARAAERAGAHIFSAMAVERLQRAAGEWRLATPSGESLAREVVVATDAYTDPAAPALRRRLIPVGSFVIVTEPLPPAVADALLPRRRMAFDSRHFLHYFRLTPDHRLLFGGRAAFAAPTAAVTERAAGVLQREMVAVFPELRGVRVEYAWSGQVAFTRDQMPRAGRLDDLWYAAGYGGHGIAMATYLGDQIARRISGETLDQPLFDDRWPAIPFYAGTPWFLPIVGSYYRLKDALGR